MLLYLWTTDTILNYVLLIQCFTHIIILITICLRKQIVKKKKVQEHTALTLIVVTPKLYIYIYICNVELVESLRHQIINIDYHFFDAKTRSNSFMPNNILLLSIDIKVYLLLFLVYYDVLKFIQTVGFHISYLMQGYYCARKNEINKYNININIL